jgi:hypothetical protein
MSLINFYYIAVGIVSLFAYFFCIYIADVSLVDLPFMSKKIKIKRNSNKLIKFSSYPVDNNFSIKDKNIIKKPKYFVFSENKSFPNNIDEHFNGKIEKLDNPISQSIFNAFINNKMMTLPLCSDIKNIDISTCDILDILYKYRHPVNIVLKFCDINESFLFYIRDNNIIKINNCDVYDEIINNIYNSEIFIICDEELKLYLSNGFLINYNVNKDIINNIFKKYSDNKYFNKLNKFDNFTIAVWSSIIID